MNRDRKQAAKKTAETNKRKFGDDFYSKIGGDGGRTRTEKTAHRGFGSVIVGPDGLTGPERSRLVNNRRFSHAG